MKTSFPDLNPIYKIKVPGSKAYTSNSGRLNANEEYTWSTRIGFNYVGERLSRLNLNYVRISLRGCDGQFLGDIEIDILTIVTGPTSYDLQLRHGMLDCRLVFSCISTETANSDLLVENIKVENANVKRLSAKYVFN